MAINVAPTLSSCGTTNGEELTMLRVRGRCWDCGCECNLEVDALPRVVGVGAIYDSETWSASICIGWLDSEEAFAVSMCTVVGTMSCRVVTSLFICGASSSICR